MFNRFLWRAQTGKALSVQAKTLLMALGGGAATAAQAWATACIIHGIFLEQQSVAEVRGFFLLMLGAVALRSLFVWGEEQMALQVSSLVKGALLERLLQQAQQLGPGVMLHKDRGAFFTLLSQGLSTMDAYFCRYLPQLFKSALIPVLYLFLAFPMDAVTGLIFLITTPLIPLFMMLIGRWSNQMKHSSWEALSRMGGYLQDVLGGLGTLRNWNQEYRQEQKIRQVSQNFRLRTMKTLQVAFLSALTLEILTTISIALIAVSLGVRLAEGTMSFLPALFLILLAPEYYQPLRMLGQQYHNSQNAIQVADEMLTFLSEPASPLPLPQTVSGPVTPPRIVLDRVGHRYPEGRQALQMISVTLEPGRIYALVGHSGAGKTTLLRTLMGTITPTEGAITVDGLPFQGWEGLAFIPAQAYFFRGTVLENITLGRKIPEETVRTICRRIGAEEFIQKLPQGYHTPLGQQGINLSGGQGQLLSIARAMAAPARILLCDEATGSLDTGTEAVVQSAMEQLFAGKTVVISAHRLHTLRRVDEVLVLQQGTLVQRGSFDSLAADRDGPFAQLLEKGLVE